VSAQAVITELGTAAVASLNDALSATLAERGATRDALSDEGIAALCHEIATEGFLADILRQLGDALEIAPEEAMRAASESDAYRFVFGCNPVAMLDALRSLEAKPDTSTASEPTLGSMIDKADRILTERAARGESALEETLDMLRASEQNTRKEAATMDRTTKTAAEKGKGRFAVLQELDATLTRYRREYPEQSAASLLSWIFTDEPELYERQRRAMMDAFNHQVWEVQQERLAELSSVASSFENIDLRSMFFRQGERLLTQRQQRMNHVQDYR
jgi:hypothetical protein